MAVPALTPAELKRQRVQVRGLLRHIHDEIASLPPQTMRALAPALAEARHELERDLRRWLAKKNGDERFTAQQYRAALVQIRGALDKVRELEPDLVRALGAGGRSAGRMALVHIQQELAAFSVHFGQTLRPTPLLTAGLLARGDKMMIPRFRSSAHRYVGNVRADLQRQLAVGVVRGETFDQLARRLVRLGGPRGLVALRGVAGEPASYSEFIAEGLFTRYGHWARRIVNTEVLTAYNVQANEALVEVHKEDPTILRRWDATLDARVCSTCRELDHQVAGIREGFPGGYDMPPAHPYCRCTLVAWRSDWSEAGAVKMAGGAQPPSPPSGSPPPPSPRPAAAPPSSPPAPAPPPPTVAAPAPIAPPPRAPKPAKPPAPSSRFDLDAVAQALADPVLPIGGGASRPPRAAQATIRLELERLVQAFGPIKQMAGAESKTLTVGSTSFMGPGTRGWHSSVTDEIAIHTQRYDEAGRFAANAAKGRAARATSDEISGFRTLVHETLHGHSPMTHRIYAGAGRVVEEVTVEAGARRIMREEFGIADPIVGFPLGATYNPLRSYDELLRDMREIVEQATGMTAVEAQNAIEEAAFAMRKRKIAPISDMRDYVDHFVKHVPIPSRLTAGASSPAVERRRLRTQVTRGIVKKWRVF